MLSVIVLIKMTERRTESWQPFGVELSVQQKHKHLFRAMRA